MNGSWLERIKMTEADHGVRGSCIKRRNSSLEVVCTNSKFKIYVAIENLKIVPLSYCKYVQVIMYYRFVDIIWTHYR